MTSYQSQLYDVKGKVVVITGASSGIGQHFASMLAKCGAIVVVGARTVPKLESLVDTIKASGGKATAHALDVSKLASIREFCQFVKQLHGRVDCLVNNAGVQVGDRPSIEHTMEDWEYVVNINLRGAWFMMQEIATIMREQDSPGGSIVNITSVLATRSTQWLVEYMSSKAGLKHASNAAALEWARFGIRVNNIAPGWVKTAINRHLFEPPSKTPGGYRYGLPDKTFVGKKIVRNVPMRRAGNVEDLDGALLLLCSDASRWMTATTITVDGGHSQSSL